MVGFTKLAIGAPPGSMDSTTTVAVATTNHSDTFSAMYTEQIARIDDKLDQCLQMMEQMLCSMSATISPHDEHASASVTTASTPSSTSSLAFPASPAVLSTSAAAPTSSIPTTAPTTVRPAATVMPMPTPASATSITEDDATNTSATRCSTQVRSSNTGNIGSSLSRTKPNALSSTASASSTPTPMSVVTIDSSTPSGAPSSFLSPSTAIAATCVRVLPTGVESSLSNSTKFSPSSAAVSEVPLAGTDCAMQLRRQDINTLLADNVQLCFSFWSPFRLGGFAGQYMPPWPPPMQCVCSTIFSEFWCISPFWPLPWLPPVHNSSKSRFTKLVPEFFWSIPLHVISAVTLEQLLASVQRWQLKHGTPLLKCNFLFPRNFQCDSCKYYMCEENVLLPLIMGARQATCSTLSYDYSRVHINIQFNRWPKLFSLLFYLSSCCTPLTARDEHLQLPPIGVTVVLPPPAKPPDSAAILFHACSYWVFLDDGAVLPYSTIYASTFDSKQGLWFRLQFMKLSPAQLTICFLEDCISSAGTCTTEKQCGASDRWDCGVVLNISVLFHFARSSAVELDANVMVCNCSPLSPHWTIKYAPVIKFHSMVEWLSEGSVGIFFANEMRIECTPHFDLYVCPWKKHHSCSRITERNTVKLGNSGSLNEYAEWSPREWTADQQYLRPTDWLENALVCTLALFGMATDIPEAHVAIGEKSEQNSVILWPPPMKIHNIMLPNTMQLCLCLWMPFTGGPEEVQPRPLWPPPRPLEFTGNTALLVCSIACGVFDCGKSTKGELTMPVRLHWPLPQASVSVCLLGAHSLAWQAEFSGRHDVVLLEITSQEVQLRPIPWPSFCEYAAAMHFQNSLAVVLVISLTELLFLLVILKLEFQEVNHDDWSYPPSPIPEHTAIKFTDRASSCF